MEINKKTRNQLRLQGISFIVLVVVMGVVRRDAEHHLPPLAQALGQHAPTMLSSTGPQVAATPLAKPVQKF